MGNSNKKFYTSDIHFAHHNLYSRGLRPFSCAQECEEQIRENFNAVIKAHDTLYILGDLSLSAKYDDLANYLTSIKGNKIVILGNHDNPKTLIQLKEDRIIANWHYWKGCHDHDTPVFMTHFVPLEAHTGPEPRLQLHGHVHGMLKGLVTCPLLYDVGVDANNYKPFSLDQLNLDLINAIRLGERECPLKEKGMLCTVCSRFIQLKSARRSGMNTLMGNIPCLEQ